ncbi:hypothetical protein NPIL_514561 [Nephila pilipes]|uniref:C2H2-type domain-containing protein n=1 Tax=Nephila pilipes TaxID=299642 RepID=A0A8X6QPF9_NEPPI|nr:hypothetical protein NPIL_514561 [Nephila pilipes]
MPHPEKENSASTSSFVCPVCDKNCSTIHGLIQHLKAHASYGKDDVAPSTLTENNMKKRVYRVGSHNAMQGPIISSSLTLNLVSRKISFAILGC